MKDEKIPEIDQSNEMNPLIRITQLIEKRTAAAIAAGDEEKKAFPYKTNGDEARYGHQAYAGNFSKTLPHDPKTALVDPSAYQALLHALQTGTLAAFDRIPPTSVRPFSYKTWASRPIPTSRITST